MWMMPEKTEWAKQQNLHEPTRSYGQEIYEVTREHFGFKKRSIEALEIGCAWGVSALAILMANSGISLTSVDVDPHNHAIEEVKVNGYEDRWNFELMSSANFFKRNSNKYDLIYVDGSHKYPTCQEDLFSAWDCLKEGGVLIADDFTHPANQKVDKDGTSVEYGVSYAVCNLICEKKIKRISSTTRLFIAYK